ncbi:toll-like receptor 13 [Protopterus annectens]|uniref:toll-like receptor 13 n=1 Tax=Protopterus annectens TaxID=7888 RepID=UPI001CFC4686|nr:toll-like receptor 13 [Protopterus annectens]
MKIKIIRSLHFVLVLQLLHIPFIVSYGFRNCIQNAFQNSSFTCIQRFIQNTNQAVSDLPDFTEYLNISYNNIINLKEYTFSHLHKLVHLEFTNNNLKTVEDGAFVNLTNLNLLNMSYNQISYLTSGVFNGLVSLNVLILEQNLLASIGNDIFKQSGNLVLLNLRSNKLASFGTVVQSVAHLEKLKELDLCNNALTSLNHSLTISLPNSLTKIHLCNNLLNDVDCRENFFENVRVLDLSYNNITNGSSLGYINLRNVTLLQIRKNNLDVFQFLNVSKIKPQSVDYSGLGLYSSENVTQVCQYIKHQPIKKLSLQHNDISNLRRNMLSHCSQISSLDLSHNIIKRIHCLEFLEQNTELEDLIIEHNRLNTLKTCNNTRRLSKLVNISLSFNRILSVQNNAFSYAPYLKLLQLNINNIAFLNKQAFSGLDYLSLLRLDNNLITDLFSTSFAKLSHLKILNLRNNRISIIFSQTFKDLRNLQTLDLGGNKIRSLTKASFFGLYNLRKLYLDRNYIKHISAEIFGHINSTLGVLDLQGNQIHYISSTIELSPFKYLSNLYDLKLQGQQPYGINIIPRHYFKGLKALHDLSLSENKLSLSEDVFEDLDNLQFLSLADACNGIHSFIPGIFKNLRNLKILSLENVGLNAIKPEVFGNLTNLIKLMLLKNDIRSINVSVFENLTSLKYIDLRKCPLSCTCSNKKLKQWLNQSQVQVVYLYDYPCADNNSEPFHSFDTHVCNSRLGEFLFFGTSTVILLCMVFPIIYKKYYWYLKYTFYIFRSWFNNQWRKQDNNVYKYDAFISYNSHDENWVFQELVHNLESQDPPSFKLCLHHRDFELGKDIIDNIVDSIYNSRKTICVISRYYLRSEWCSLEIQLASYRLFEQLQDIVILIFLENIPNRELSVYQRMRKVMLKKTYINWPSEPEEQKLFWTKVKDALGTGSSTIEESQNALIV